MVIAGFAAFQKLRPMMNAARPSDAGDILSPTFLTAAHLGVINQEGASVGFSSGAELPFFGVLSAGHKGGLGWGRDDGDLPVFKVELIVGTLCEFPNRPFG